MGWNLRIRELHWIISRVFQLKTCSLTHWDPLRDHQADKGIFSCEHINLGGLRRSFCYFQGSFSTLKALGEQHSLCFNQLPPESLATMGGLKVTCSHSAKISLAGSKWEKLREKKLELEKDHLERHKVI